MNKKKNFLGTNINSFIQDINETKANAFKAVERRGEVYLGR